MSAATGPGILEAAAAATLVTTEVLVDMMRLIEQGMTAERCDLYEDGELDIAANFYLVYQDPAVPEFWPLPVQFWQPTDRRTNWIRVQAFLLLEIMRLDRAAAKTVAAAVAR